MKAIKIDPEIMGGCPCLAGHRIPIETLLSHIFCGGTIEEFCLDYEIDKKLIDEAIDEIEDNIGSWIISGEATKK